VAFRRIGSSVEDSLACRSLEALSLGGESCLVEGGGDRVALLCGASLFSTFINILLILSKRSRGLTSGDTEQIPRSPWYGIVLLATNKLLAKLDATTECNTVLDLVFFVLRAPCHRVEMLSTVV
jgi:hypothetical protein